MSGRAVVIGSGVGGLAAALLLARDGWSVTVLEQHTRAGGFLHRFFREGVGYDTGFHYVGAAAPDQLVGRMLHHLGVADQLRFTPLDPEGFDLLRFPGLEVAVPAGLDRWLDRLGGIFPAERAGLARYKERHLAAIAAYGWYNLDLSTPPEAILPWEEQTLQQVLDDCFIDPRIKVVLGGQSALYGVPAPEAPFGLHAIVTDHFLTGAWTVEGGGDHLAMVLVRRLRGLGGRVLLRPRAEAIDVEAGRVTAVHAAGGRFPADLVVADIHPRLTLDLLPAGSTRPAYRTRVTSARPGRAHLGLYLRVRGDVGDLARRNLYRYASWDPEAIARPATAAHVPFWYLTAPGRRDPRQRPGVDEVVLGLLQVDAATFSGPASSGAASGVTPGPPVHGDHGYADDPAYQAQKAALLDASLAAIRTDYPGWEILRAEVSTPRTTERYGGTFGGATYGHAHTVDQMGRHRLPMQGRVGGLVHVGQTVGFPGICGAMMTAYVACAPLLGAERLVDELRGGVQPDKTTG